MSDVTAYLAAEGFEADLRTELGDVLAEHGRLMLAPGPARQTAWAQNIWRQPQRLEVASIGEAAKALRALQRNWWPYEFHLHRRTALLVDKLPKVSAKPLVFGQPAPTAPLGSFVWLDESTVLAAPDCSSAFPNGDAAFIEDHQAPPARAYLKLWEALTLAGNLPKPGELCLDLGASPGGWTWVLAGTGARVISIDKAPLAPAIAALPNVEYRQGSAFGLEPEAVGPVDWLCSDVICYPERLLRLVERWLSSGLARNLICTLKFQGETDFATARKFAGIPGSRLLHLSHNKHELTWMRLATP
ncbi:Predicted SAM-dependent methyltransferase [Candidatus Terasakiella magnetica]|nr:Predicted SAM-dependent methyltransferase [Candidatus Terasakiella magnetica]